MDSTNEPIEAHRKTIGDALQVATRLGDGDIKRSSSATNVETRIARQIAIRDFAGAFDSLELARQNDAVSMSRLRLLEAHIAIGRDDLERAYSILIESLPDVRFAPQQHDLLAAVMLRTSRYAQAAAVYRALLTIDPTQCTLVGRIRGDAGETRTPRRVDRGL